MKMNKMIFPCALAFAALSLCSCNGLFEGNGGGRVVNYPTVDDMARIDREMGLETKSHNATRTNNVDGESGAAVAARAQAAAQAAPQQPAVQTPPVAPAPQPQIPELPPSSTIQKLRN